MASAMVNPPVVQAKALQCPNCGGPVQLRGFAHTLNVVCPQCLSVLDASSPLVRVIQQFQGQQRIQPMIALGSRGVLGGVNYEVIGFQVRTVDYEDGSFSWNEYLLFNPYKGFRYLSEYNGHWNFIRALHALPVPTGNILQFQSQTYRHFSHAVAKTSYVLGEFPWQVRVGETVQVDDYIAPPLMLSGETTEGEVTWSQGEYVTGLQLWQAFRFPPPPPPAIGVFANQPAPATGAASAWLTWAALMALLVMMALFVSATAGRREVFRQKYSYAPGGTAESAVVTSDFDLTGKTSSVEIDTNTDLHGEWCYFTYALVSRSNGKAHNFGREVTKQKDRAVLSSIPSGRYYLRIEPDKAAGSSPINYEIIVRRDVPSYGWFVMAA
ncbi:MAG: DUF4178 domain-containing protein, partial [Acidobacteriaceae bacterium]|nr:DUF4178 domain-containing protein [Acidobacteriaceae bacterium]